MINDTDDAQLLPYLVTCYDQNMRQLYGHDLYCFRTWGDPFLSRSKLVVGIEHGERTTRSAKVLSTTMTSLFPHSYHLILLPLTRFVRITAAGNYNVLYAIESLDWQPMTVRDIRPDFEGQPYEVLFAAVNPWCPHFLIRLAEDFPLSEEDDPTDERRKLIVDMCSEALFARGYRPNALTRFRVMGMDIEFKTFRRIEHAAPVRPSRRNDPLRGAAKAAAARRRARR